MKITRQHLKEVIVEAIEEDKEEAKDKAQRLLDSIEQMMGTLKFIDEHVKIGYLERRYIDNLGRVHTPLPITPFLRRLYSELYRTQAQLKKAL